MKILTAAQIKEADDYTIKHEPIASIDLMERASMAFVAQFVEILDSKRPIIVVCGMGNNGGGRTGNSKDAPGAKLQSADLCCKR